jgi:hypothetical protein
MITDKLLENLGGIVEGKKRTYRIDVKRKAGKPGEVQIDQLFDIVATDNATGEVVRPEVFRMKPEDHISDLESLVNIMKHSASRDFD